MHLYQYHRLEASHEISNFCNFNCIYLFPVLNDAFQLVIVQYSFIFILEIAQTSQLLEISFNLGPRDFHSAIELFRYFFKFIVSLANLTSFISHK